MIEEPEIKTRLGLYEKKLAASISRRVEFRIRKIRPLLKRLRVLVEEMRTLIGDSNPRATIQRSKGERWATYYN